MKEGFLSRSTKSGNSISRCNCSEERVTLVLHRSAINNRRHDCIKGLLLFTELWAISNNVTFILSAWDVRDGNGSLTSGVRHVREADKISS
jgi:hypothetical protein